MTQDRGLRTYILMTMIPSFLREPEPWKDGPGAILKAPSRVSAWPQGPEPSICDIPSAAPTKGKWHWSPERVFLIQKRALAFHRTDGAERCFLEVTKEGRKPEVPLNGGLGVTPMGPRWSAGTPSVGGAAFGDRVKRSVAFLTSGTPPAFPSHGTSSALLSPEFEGNV